MSHSFTNPYSAQDFFGFFALLTGRLGEFFSTGSLTGGLASDEIQIIVLAGVAASAALVGSFLVLRRMTMLANSLSHTILLGIVIAFLLTQGNFFSHDPGTTFNIQAMLFASFFMGLVTTFLTELLTKTAKLQEDASIGLVFTTLFALGIILVTVFTREAHIGTEVVMGNVDILNIEDFKLVYLALALNLSLGLLFFKEYTITTFDEPLAKSLGISTLFFNYLLMLQVSATVVSGFRAVGVLMILAFLTAPPLTARLLTHNLKKMVLLAAAIGVLGSFIGVALSRHLLSVYGIALSTGGLTVCVLGVIYALVAAGWLIKKKRTAWQRG